MTLTAASVLHYWSSRYDSIPRVGGMPTHSRNSAASWIDVTGKVNSQIVNTPRYNHATVSGEANRQVLTLEQASTNQAPYSEDSTQWTQVGGGSLTAAAMLAPDGSSNGVKVVFGATGYVHPTNRWSTNANTRTFTVSLWMRGAAGGEQVDIGGLNQGDSGLSSGLCVLTTNWVRYTFTFTAASSTITLAPFIQTASGTPTIYAWGWQLEEAPAVSSYIKTGSLAVTRSADSLVYSFTPVPQALMAYLRLVERGGVATGTALFSVGGDPGGTKQFRIDSNGFNYRVYHHDGTSSVSEALSVAPNYGDTVELVALLQSGGNVEIIQSINGAPVTSSGISSPMALGASWFDQTLWLNSLGAGNYCMGDYAESKVVKYADVVASTAQGILDELAAFELDASGNKL